MAQATAVDVLVLAGTKDGVYLLRSDSGRGDWRVRVRPWSGTMSATWSATAAARSGRRPTPGWRAAIFHSEDEGATWLRCGELPACERAWHVRPAARTRMAGSGRESCPPRCCAPMTAVRRGRTCPGSTPTPHARSGGRAAAGSACTRSSFPRGSRAASTPGSRWRGSSALTTMARPGRPPTREPRRWRSLSPRNFRRQGRASRRPSLRAQGRARSNQPRDALHAAARRGLPLRRRWAQLDQYRGWFAVAVRVPRRRGARVGSGRMQRLGDPGEWRDDPHRRRAARLAHG